MIQFINQVLFALGPIGVGFLAWRGGATAWRTAQIATVVFVLPLILMILPAAVIRRFEGVSREEAAFYLSSDYFGFLHFAIVFVVVCFWYKWPDRSS